MINTSGGKVSGDVEKAIELARVKLISPGAIVPRRATPGAAGYDLASSCALTIQPMDVAKVPTGISISLPAGCYARVAPRSGMSVKKVLATGGVVDSDYRGEIFVLLHNLSDEPFEIKPRDRIAQIIFEKIYLPEIVIVDEMDYSQRGCSGFGSTGI